MSSTSGQLQRDGVQQRQKYFNRNSAFIEDWSKGHYEKVKKALLEKQVDLSFSDYDDRTALHLAAASNRVGICRLLIDHKAPLTAQDRWGATPAQ